jgi:hypothetical protein
VGGVDQALLVGGQEGFGLVLLREGVHETVVGHSPLEQGVPTPLHKQAPTSIPLRPYHPPAHLGHGTHTINARNDSLQISQFLPPLGHRGPQFPQDAGLDVADLAEDVAVFEVQIVCGLVFVVVALGGREGEVQGGGCGVGLGDD